jgi:tRNA modification GTPase
MSCGRHAAPKCYTRRPENFSTKITTHGGLLAPAEVLAALLAAGARAATPGEFTRRALANGKIDLLQAEATADIVDATAPAQRRTALRQLDRGLSQRVGSLRDRVLELEALVSYDIDFPEEDDGPVAPAQIDSAVGALQVLLGDLLGTAAEGERLREGALCVIAGAPNTGKSSLFNAMIGDERAIVTEIAGTTRDAIEAAVTCGGYPFRLIDTAGLREDADRIERLGIEVSRRYLDAANVILFCVDSGRPINEHESLFVESADVPVLVVRTKSDKLVGQQARDGLEEALKVSAHTGEGLQDLRDGLARLAFAGLSGATNLDAVVTRERHRVALGRALEEVNGFAAARADGLEAAVAATHLRAAVTALEDIIGLVTSDDVLDRVFASFCVGK